MKYFSLLSAWTRQRSTSAPSVENSTSHPKPQAYAHTQTEPKLQSRSSKNNAHDAAPITSTAPTSPPRARLKMQQSSGTHSFSSLNFVSSQQPQDLVPNRLEHIANNGFQHERAQFEPSLRRTHHINGHRSDMSPYTSDTKLHLPSTSKKWDEIFVNQQVTMLDMNASRLRLNLTARTPTTQRNYSSTPSNTSSHSSFKSSSNLSSSTLYKSDSDPIHSTSKKWDEIFVNQQVTMLDTRASRLHLDLTARTPTTQRNYSSSPSNTSSHSSFKSSSNLSSNTLCKSDSRPIHSTSSRNWNKVFVNQPANLLDTKVGQSRLDIDPTMLIKPQRHSENTARRGLHTHGSNEPKSQRFAIDNNSNRMMHPASANMYNLMSNVDSPYDAAFRHAAPEKT